MMQSIKVRLLLWIIGGMAVLLAVFSVVVYHVMRRSLLDGFDAVLASTALAICGSVEQGNGVIKAEIDEYQSPEFFRSEKPGFFQMWHEDGRSVLRSPSIKGVDLERFEGPLGATLFRSARLPDGRPGRAVSLSFVPKAEDEAKETTRPRKATLVVARETAALDSEIGFLRWLLIAASGGMVILALLVGAVVVRQGLKPFEELALRIAAVRHDDLSAQIPSDRMPPEMAPVVERLNDLLQRLEAAFRRERAFTADVAHELRTPLAGMRCTLEVALTRQRADDDYRQTMAECLGIIRQTQAMVDSLLVMARLEEGHRALHPETMRLDTLIEATWQPLAETVYARAIDFESHVPTNLECTADRDNLKIILTNLLLNAAEYTNEGGRISLLVEENGGSILLSIANTGCCLSAEDTRHVFEPFWRGDVSRSDTGVHCGLGLALVHRAATAIGGTVDARTQNGTFTVRFVFPASSNAQSQIACTDNP